MGIGHCAHALTDRVAEDRSLHTAGERTSMTQTRAHVTWLEEAKLAFLTHEACSSSLLHAF